MLAKAKSQVSSTGRGNCQELNEDLDANLDDDDDEDLQASARLLGDNMSKNEDSNNSSDNSFEAEQQEAGVMMSQMDISAAHLILAYMEKHLEDKERLQREWRELNENSSLFGSANGAKTKAANQQQTTSATNAKVSQLMMQKLAKVALSDENRHKNRNCLVVPYDRNRVKLSTPGGSTNKPAKSNPALAVSRKCSSTESNKQHNRSDYINASYIYDDSRRPTHIIAQGPTEQTVSAFWQVSGARPTD